VIHVIFLGLFTIINNDSNVVWLITCLLFFFLKVSNSPCDRNLDSDTTC